jgi:hypothetical protein
VAQKTRYKMKIIILEAKFLTRYASKSE